MASDRRAVQNTEQDRAGGPKATARESKASGSPLPRTLGALEPIGQTPTADAVLQLQRLVGNRATAAAVQGRLASRGRAARVPRVEEEVERVVESGIGMQPGLQAGADVQRFPTIFQKKPDVFTDDRFSWMRMILRDDLGEDTFELLETDGSPSGSYMIFQREYDQYRFSSNGVDFDEEIPPHFMEEITGDASIDDEEGESYSYVGEYGVGYRPSEGKKATIELSGMISCIGFVLRGEGAVFACHMVVVEGAPKDEKTLKDQVNALVAKYEKYVGSKPAYCQLWYNESTYRGQPSWLKWMMPDGVKTYIEPVRRDVKVTVVGEAEGRTLMWRGKPIRY